MADQTQAQKRTREEETSCFEGDYEDPKRPKTYNNHILSFLEDDEKDDELNRHQEFSDIFTSLQQELSCEREALPFTASSEADHHQLDQHGAAASDYTPTSSKDGEGEEDNDERVRVMRHLLEASDDELGLPNSLGISGAGYDDEIINGGDLPFSLNEWLWEFEGLWEFEDEAANYYAMLQAELFI